ncbi:MAG: VWA domain-containing protein [Pirellulaceae bacterium]
MDPTQSSPENTSDKVLPASADNTADRVSQLEQAKRELEAQLAAAKRPAQEKPVAEKPAGKTAAQAAVPKGAKAPQVAKKTLPTAASLPTAKRAATANAPQKSSPPQQDSPDESESADNDTNSWWPGSRQVPAWAISMIVHLILFLILGLITIAIPATADFSLIAGSQDANEPLEQMAEVDIADELENMEELSPSFDSPQVNDSDMSELTLASTVADADDLGPEVIESDSVSQINAIFSDSGSAMESLTDKVGKMTASFFGSKSKGRRFVFVVDNSNSMTRGRFHTALTELAKTVEQMDNDQYFYVIFFSDTAYPLFWPSPVSQLVPATRKNKERLYQWLYTVELCLYTRGEAAMQMALSLRPDTIYILGDGAFTDNTTAKLTQPHNRRIPIFTLGMEVPEKGKSQLTRIANSNQGTYRLVAVAPGAARAAQQFPLKKNRTRGPIWGVKLPPP